MEDGNVIGGSCMEDGNVIGGDDEQARSWASHPIEGDVKTI